MNKKAAFAALLFTSFAAAERISFTAANMRGKSGDEESRATLSGNARVTTESMEINADEIELSGEDFRFIRGEGNIKGTNKDADTNFEADSLSYDRQTKIATLTGRVSFFDTENDVTATAGIIDYDEDRQIAVMQINVRLTDENNECTCAHAVYRKQDRLLEMRGDAQVVRDDDTFRAQEITLNLDTEEITLTGRVRGSVTASDEEDAGGTPGGQSPQPAEP